MKLIFHDPTKNAIKSHTAITAGPHCKGCIVYLLAIYYWHYSRLDLQLRVQSPANFLCLKHFVWHWFAAVVCSCVSQWSILSFQWNQYQPMFSASSICVDVSHTNFIPLIWKIVRVKWDQQCHWSMGNSGLGRTMLESLPGYFTCRLQIDLQKCLDESEWRQAIANTDKGELGSLVPTLSKSQSIPELQHKKVAFCTSGLQKADRCNWCRLVQDYRTLMTRLLMHVAYRGSQVSDEFRLTATIRQNEDGAQRVTTTEAANALWSGYILGFGFQLRRRFFSTTNASAAGA